MNKTFRIPGFLWLLIPYFFYKFFVDFYFNDECHGSYYLTSRKDFFIIAIFFALLMIFNSNINKRQASILNNYILILIILAPIVTMIQVFNPSFLQINYFLAADTFSIYSQRRPSLFGFEDPNALGFTYLPLALTFINIRILEHKKKLLLLYIVSIVVVLVFSNTRYIMFGLILIFIQLILSSKNKLKALSYFLIFFIISLIIFSYLYSFVGFDLTNLYNNRLHDQGSTYARFASYNAFMKLFPHYLFWGIGNQVAPPILNELKGASPFIHIGILNHLMVYGLVGSTFLYGFWFGLFRRLYKRGKKTKYWAALFAFLFFLWANVSLVMYSIFFSGLLLAFISEKFYTVEILKRKIEGVKTFSLTNNHLNPEIQP
jgi:hypothetical protein